MRNDTLRRLFLPMIALILGSFTHTTRAQDDSAKLVRVSMESSVDTIHPGDRFLLAFHFEIAPLWHIYWANPGDTGSPTAIKVAAPEGFVVGDILWQRPQIIPAEFLTLGYEERVVLFAPITAPEQLESGAAEFEARIDWLVCQQSCQIGLKEQSLEIPMSSAPRPASDREPEEFIIESSEIARAFARLPREMGETPGTALLLEGDRLHLTGPAHGFAQLDVFVNHSPGVTSRIIRKEIADDRFVIELAVTVKEANALDEPPVARGVIALGLRRDDPSYRFEAKLGD